MWFNTNRPIFNIKTIQFYRLTICSYMGIYKNEKINNGVWERAQRLSLASCVFESNNLFTCTAVWLYKRYLLKHRNVHFLGTLFAKDGRKGIDAIMIGDQSYRISGWASANISFPLAVSIIQYIHFFNMIHNKTFANDF